MYAKQLSIDDYLKNTLRNLDTAEIDITVNEEDIKQALMQIESLHNFDDGYITIAVKRKSSWQQHHYKRAELKANIAKPLSFEHSNIYISPNSFYKPFRRIQNVRKLNALYIDLDYYTLEAYKDMTADQILWQLEKDYFKREVPEASFVVITGQGIAIYWLIEPVPSMALPLWNAVQKFFLEKLKEIGADAKSIDAARVMRLAGSTNQKNGQAAEILVYDNKYRYSLRDIQEEYMPKLTPYVKNPELKKSGRKSKVVKLYTKYNLHYSRLMDIVKLQKMRDGMCRNHKGQLINTGQREFMCFLYRYWSCCYIQNTDKALDDTLDFNNGFVSPLSESEVIRQTRAAESAFEEWKLNDLNIKKKKKGTDEFIIDKELKKKADKLKEKRKGYELLGYNYTNERLIKLLCITEDEMRELKTIIGKTEVKRRTNIRTNEHNKAKFKKQRRNEDGLTNRDQAKLYKMKAVKELKERGLTQKEITKELNLGIATVKRYYSEIHKKDIM